MQDLFIILIIGFILSLGIVAIVMPFYIRLLKSLHYEQRVSEYALEEYKNKAKTPIMGGLLFVVVPIIVCIVVYPNIINDKSALMIMLSYFLFFLVGFLDDILIILRNSNEGLNPKLKMLMQLVFGLLIVLVFKDILDTRIIIPIIDISIDLGYIIYAIFAVFVFTAESNAVNFTDGMDGLCAGVSAISLIAFLILAIYLKRYNVALIIACVEGGLIGYLYYNFFPAKIFMGDSGSLALGALFVAIAMVLKQELLLIVVGGVFLWEMICVCLQQLSVRLFHKRIFKYTPIHYAFVIRGLKEKKVVLLFYALAIVCTVLGTLIGVL